MATPRKQKRLPFAVNIKTAAQKAYVSMTGNDTLSKYGMAAAQNKSQAAATEKKILVEEDSDSVSQSSSENDIDLDDLGDF